MGGLMVSEAGRALLLSLSARENSFSFSFLEPSHLLMSWDGPGELWSGSRHWTPLAARLGGGRGGIISLTPRVWPLCQQIVLSFYMEGSRDPLQSSNSWRLLCQQQQQEQNSGRLQSPHRELGCTAESLTQIASCTNLDIPWVFYTGPC